MVNLVDSGASGLLETKMTYVHIPDPAASTSLVSVAAIFSTPELCAAMKTLRLRSWVGLPIDEVAQVKPSECFTLTNVTAREAINAIVARY